MSKYTEKRLLKHQQETTRTRPQGTRVINTLQAADPGLARIEAVQAIVDKGQYCKIDGLMVDLFSASCILQIYRAIRPEYQSKYRNLPIRKMATMAFKLCQ